MKEENKLLNFLEIKLDKLFSFFGKHFFILTLVYFLIAFFIRIIFAPNLILREDAFLYFLKATEMSRGDFSPLLTHAYGWSFVLSLILKFFSGAGIFQQMFYARIASCFLDALAIFPLAYIAKQFIKKENVYIVLSIFVFIPQLIYSAISATSEPLFTFILLMSLVCVYKAFKNPKYILLASFFASASFYVRHNGIFVFLAIIISFILLKKHIFNFKYKYILFAFLVFMVASAPLLMHRYVSFGTPMFYGENSKYFVDSYHADVWSPNIPVPSAVEYLRTHSINDYFDKFFINGICKLFLSYYFAIPTALLFLFVFGFLIFFKEKAFRPLVVVVVIWIISLTPVWSVYGLPRHLYPTLFLVALFASAVLQELFKNIKYKHLGQSLFVTVFAIISLFILLPLYNSIYNSSHSADSFNDHFNDTAWADWAGRNVKGVLAIRGGSEWIFVNLKDAQIGDSASMYEYSAPATGLSTKLIGNFKDLSSAMEWFKQEGVTHIAVDNLYLDRRPFLKEIADKNPVYLEEIYSNIASQVDWKVQIFSIDWSVYDEEI
ncbi:glycosyltransferase family 39 protein [Candidatus Parcubacteria bacterium]|nr:glycosyltransferase family 39 protein [Candidatus Parcubacteria bacterium]